MLLSEASLGQRLTEDQLATIASTGELTDEEFNQLVINSTPSLWAETYLHHPDNPEEPLTLYWYQKDIIDDPSTMKCIRMGRQMGKEQPYSAQVLTPDGFVEMGSLAIGSKVIAMDGSPTTVLDIYEQGVKDVYKLTFDDGSEAECGLDHLWLCRTKKLYNDNTHRWKTKSLKEIIEYGGLTPDSDLAIRIPLCKPVEFQKRQHIISPYILGVILGDGGVSQGSIFITSADQEIVDRVNRELPVGYILTKQVSNGSKATTWRISIDKTRPDLFTPGYNTLPRNILKDEIVRLNLLGTKSATKFIPWEYLHDSIENRTDLLRGLMDTDGHAPSTGSWEYCTKSDRLAKDFIWLTESLGGKVYRRKKTNKLLGTSYWYLYPKQLSMNPFYLPRKAELYYQIKYYPTRILKKIEKVRQENSRCILVEHPTHTYITNNFIVTHNSVVLLALILWELMTESNIKVFLYLPGKSQLERIYEILNNFVLNSPLVRESIDQESIKEGIGKKDAVEHAINFKNKSRLIVFICDKNIEKIRSHQGGKIYIDESDYLKPAAIQAILGIFVSAKSPFMWQSSTPRGKYGHFYKFANSKDVKAWHFKSSQAPHWTAEKDAAIRASCPDEATYNREVNADWSDEADTVYPEQLLISAVAPTIRDYGNAICRTFGENNRFMDSNQLFNELMAGRRGLFIGIDWNSPTHGVRIIYLVRTKEGRIACAKVEAIRDKMFTQTQAVSKVLEIYQMYNPDRIYADLGYGAVQAELIYTYAKQHGKVDLMTKFRSIDFSNVVSITNNVNSAYTSKEERIEVKVRYKTLMINLVSKCLKEGRLILPAFEEQEDGLITELRQFKLKEIGLNGEPVYSKDGGQHAHMALALAVLADYEFTKEEAKVGSLPGIIGNSSPKEERRAQGIPERPSRTADLRQDSINIFTGQSFRGRSPFSNAGRRSTRRIGIE